MWYILLSCWPIIYCIIVVPTDNGEDDLVIDDLTPSQPQDSQYTEVRSDCWLHLKLYTSSRTVQAIAISPHRLETGY